MSIHLLPLCSVSVFPLLLGFSQYCLLLIYVFGVVLVICLFLKFKLSPTLYFILPLLIFCNIHIQNFITAAWKYSSIFFFYFPVFKSKCQNRTYENNENQRISNFKRNYANIFREKYLSLKMSLKCNSS